MRVFAESLTHGEGRKSFPMFVCGASNHGASPIFVRLRERYRFWYFIVIPGEARDPPSPAP